MGYCRMREGDITGVCMSIYTNHSKENIEGIFLQGDPLTTDSKPRDQ